MNFNRTTFTNNLKHFSSLSLADNATWSYWNDGTRGTLNQQLPYSFTNPANGNDQLNYRTWSPEQSDLPNNLGGLLSCKIDFANGAGDDHVILIVGFVHSTSGAQMVLAQASVQFHGADSNNVEIDPIKSNDPSYDFPGQVYSKLHNAISAHYSSNSHDDQGRLKLATVAQANVNAFNGAVSF